MIYQNNHSDIYKSPMNLDEKSESNFHHGYSLSNMDISKEHDLKQQLNQLKNELTAASEKIDELEQCLAHSGRCSDNLQHAIVQMKHSRGWKLTSPLRGIAAGLRRFRNPLSVEINFYHCPAHSITQVSAGTFRVTGMDPQLLNPEPFRRGIYLFKWEGSATKRILMKIYPDYGQGHLEIDSQALGYLSSEYAPHERFIQVKHKAKNLRVDPGDGGSNTIFIGDFRYIRLDFISAVRVGLSLISRKTGHRKTHLLCHFLKLYFTGNKHEVMNQFAAVFKKYGDGHLAGNNEEAYQQYIQECEPTAAQLSKQVEQAKHFNIKPLISIIVPVYNTNKQMLIDMIESVICQTYSNWELCLADGHSPKLHVVALLKEYAAKDSRIKVKILANNLGIAGNSNAALELATGDYIGLLDHDDLLPKWALFMVAQTINNYGEPDILYSDEDKITFDGKQRFFPHFKPEWSPDLLRSYNYITHFFVAKRNLVTQAGNFLPGYDGSQDHDLILRTTELTDKIVHIPQILYHWRSHSESTAQNQGNKSYTLEAGARAISAQLQRKGIKGEVTFNQKYGFYHVGYYLTSNPLVSIIIPNYEHMIDLQRCLDSIYHLSTYKNFEIIIVENNSKTKDIFAYYKQIRKLHGVHIIKWEGEFNYSAINNYAVRAAKGEVLLFLNNDTEVITPDWIEQMLQYVQRPDVGCVGAKLYYPDDTIQHAGVLIGFRGIAGHSFSRLSKEDPGYMGRAIVIQDVSAVTAACMMITEKLFNELGGLDETLKVAFNDVDLCMKIRQAGKLIVYTPYSELYHHESVSRGLEDTNEKRARFLSEIEYFKSKWSDQLLAGDPYYNPHLDLEQTPYRVSGK